jgi:hypothetical protein
MESKSKMQDQLILLPWISYRCGFTEIDGYTSDTGWGCMIRVAQMMLCTTLMRHIAFQLTLECQTKYKITYKELKQIGKLLNTLPRTYYEGVIRFNFAQIRSIFI